MPAFFSKASSLQGRLALLLALALAAPAFARDSEPAQLAEKTSEELNKLKPLTDAKNWDGAMNLLANIQANVSPTSYDYAIVSDIKSKILMQKGKLGCIRPGAHADLLVVEGDPLADIELLAANGRNLRLIMRGGELVRNELA